MIELPDASSQKVRQLPVKHSLVPTYSQRILQPIFDRHLLMLRALQVDVKLLYDTGLVALSEEDKVLLDKLLVEGTIDPTVPQVLEDIIDLQNRVTALEP